MPDLSVAVLADVHGNADALAAVLDDIAGLGPFDAVLNLGDHFSAPLFAAEVAAQLRALPGMVAIRGNHDRYLLETDPETMGHSDRTAFDQLSPDDFAWLAELPATHVWRDTIFMCHGTPETDEAYWTEEVSASGQVGPRPKAQVEQIALGVDYPVLLYAHSHTPRVRHLADGRLMVNPGSVGCPGYIDDAPVPHAVATFTPNACYAVLTRASGLWSAQLRYVPYDTTRVVAHARALGRDHWANALATGDPLG